MEVNKIDPQVWLFNLRQSVGILIESEIHAGYKIKAIVISRFLFNKMTEILGYEPNSMFGYMLEILPESELVFENETELEDEDVYGQDDVDGYIGLRSEPIN